MENPKVADAELIWGRERAEEVEKRRGITRPLCDDQQTINKQLQ